MRDFNSEATQVNEKAARGFTSWRPEMRRLVSAQPYFAFIRRRGMRPDKSWRQRAQEKSRQGLGLKTLTAEQIGVASHYGPTRPNPI